jgi:hypothetical protein
MQGLIVEGWRRSEMIHDFLTNNPVGPFTEWPTRLMFLGMLTYATSLARLVDMNRTDFMALCAGLFDSVEVTIAHAADRETANEAAMNAMKKAKP